MTSTVCRRLATAGLVIGIVAAAPAAAVAHDELISSDGAVKPGYTERHLGQHGGTAEHLEATSSNVDLVSKLQLKNVESEKIADVGVSPDGNTAFLAAWGEATCRSNGVHVVDIADPAKPRETAFIGSKEGSHPGEACRRSTSRRAASTANPRHQQRDLQGQGRLRRH